MEELFKSYNENENNGYVRVHEQQFDMPFVLVQVKVLRRATGIVPFATVFRDSTGYKVQLMKDLVPSTDEIYPWDASLLQVQLFSTTEITRGDTLFSAMLSARYLVTRGAEDEEESLRSFEK